MISSGRGRAVRPIYGLICAAILVASPTIPQAGEPLSAQQRQELTQVLDKLTASRTAMAAMISDCSGGMIMAFACSQPLKTAHPAGCIETVASCDLVAAFRDTDAAIADLQKSLER